jgi:hypothetical protein
MPTSKILDSPHMAGFFVPKNGTTRRNPMAGLCYAFPPGPPAKPRAEPQPDDNPTTIETRTEESRND